MQRLFSLAIVAALMGGGGMYLTGMRPADLAKILSTVSQNAQQGQPYSGQPQQAPGGYQAPTPPSPGSVSYVPSQPSPGSTIKIATYNIQKFGDTKAQNPYVMRVLGAIVQNLDVVAIQEITTKDEHFIDKFLQAYVNNKGRRYSRAVGPRLGRTSYKEQYAFIYDTNTIEINPQVNYTVSDPDDLLHREPQVAMFRARGAPPTQAFTFMLINVHTDPDETDTEFDALAQVYQHVQRNSAGEDDVILLGDLNTDVSASPQGYPSTSARGLRPSDLRGLGRLGYLYPVIRNQSTNTAGSKLNDNLLIHRGATTEFTGNAGVIDVQRVWGLSSDDAAKVSDHLPVWAEFSVYESVSPGRMAQQPTMPSR